MRRSYLVIAALLALSAPAFADANGSAAGAQGPAKALPKPVFPPVFPMAADIPACNDPAMLYTVAHQFSRKESGFWSSNLEIQAIDDVQEIGLNANGDTYIPRRYCVGKARLSDGGEHRVVYQIEHGLGFAGYTEGVESCVIDFDRDFAYAPRCSVLRPLVDRYANEKINLQYH